MKSERELLRAFEEIQKEKLGVVSHSATIVMQSRATLTVNM